MHPEKRPCEDTARRSPSASQGEASEETKSADIFILDLQPPELWENKLLLFKPPSLWTLRQPWETDKSIISMLKFLKMKTIFWLRITVSLFLDNSSWNI